MPKMLNDGAVEYEDGTPATEAQVSFLTFHHNWILNFTCKSMEVILFLVLAQMGKDIVSFLSWAAACWAWNGREKAGKGLTLFSLSPPLSLCPSYSCHLSCWCACKWSYLETWCNCYLHHLIFHLVCLVKENKNHLSGSKTKQLFQNYVMAIKFLYMPLRLGIYEWSQIGHVPLFDYFF